jgi:hypothetical protein
LKLLDALADDRLIDESVAKRIRENANFVEQLEKEVASARAAARRGGSDWHMRSQPNLEVYYRYAKATGKVEIVGELNVDMPAAHLWAFVREFDLAHEWLPNAHECRYLHSYQTHCELYRVGLHAPIPLLSPMVAIQERNYHDVLDELGSLTVVVESPEVSDESWRDVSIPPDNKGEKRIKQIVRNQVKIRSKDESTLVLFLILETGIPSLPDFLVGKVAAIVLSKFAAKVGCAKSRWAEAGWKERYENGPRAEYYRLVDSKIAVALAKMNDTSKDEGGTT